MHEFFELKLGIMIIEEYDKKFLELLRYVDFIKDEKVKFKRFISGMLVFYRHRINYDPPSHLDEVIRKAKCMYNQSKGRPELYKTWKSKIGEKKDQRSKNNLNSFVVPRNMDTFQDI